jgi:phosphate transport system protein
MTEHTSKQFDADLEHIRTRVLQMGGMVEMQIFKALEGFQSGDIPFLDKVIDDDHRVNLLEVELDEACSQVIAKRQPAASDLRMIMTVIKTITDLERVGDEAKKIAKMSRRVHSSETAFTPQVELKHTANLAVDMLRQSLDAFARLDVNAAAQVVRQDSEVDRSFKSTMRQLITYMMEDPRTISHSLELLFIAKAIERIGDHAKNIAEYVIYMVKGRDVRHIGVAEIEKEVARS